MGWRWEGVWRGEEDVVERVLSRGGRRGGRGRVLCGEKWWGGCRGVGEGSFP